MDDDWGVPLFYETPAGGATMHPVAIPLKNSVQVAKIFFYRQIMEALHSMKNLHISISIVNTYMTYIYFYIFYPLNATIFLHLVGGDWLPSILYFPMNLGNV